MRFDPQALIDGRNPLSIDSAPPTEKYQEFLMGEVRYNSLKMKAPERAEELFRQAEDAAMARYSKLLHQKKEFENN